jgi:hypothetical protein
VSDIYCLCCYLRKYLRWKKPYSRPKIVIFWRIYSPLEAITIVTSSWAKAMSIGLYNACFGLCMRQRGRERESSRDDDFTLMGKHNLKDDLEKFDILDNLIVMQSILQISTLISSGVSFSKG